MEELPHCFTVLPVRPPTPPKEHGFDDIMPSIEQTFGSIRMQPEPPYTPDESPASVNNFQPKASAKTTKHVGFSPLSPNLGLSGYLSLIGTPRVVPPSRDCTSRKSILKSYNIQTTDLSKAEYKDVAEMLENVCRGLASQTKSTRLDAYMSLMSCLKLYKDLPERESLESKVALLADFIKRDMSTEAEDIVDTQIRVQSLKLLIFFLADPSLTNQLPFDIQCHILDKSIRILEEHTASKAIVNLHLHILATQDFRSSVITESKALDVLAALEDLTDHVKGNGTVGFRLRIYQRLLRQSKQAMVKCASVWVSHLFIGMLSNLKETRMQAINFGREASITLGTQSKVSNVVQDIFNQQSPSGKTFVSTVIKRLNEMNKGEDEKTDVPHVWGVVVMFLRSRPRQLEHWAYMGEWMGILPKCFNSSNRMVNHHASLAWNRLVCAVDLSTSTSPGMIRALKQPIKAQLERSILEKTSHRTKQMAHSSYCTLLYYAFRPQRPMKQFDIFWEECVLGLLMDKDDLLGKLDTEYVLEILTYLFDFGQPWNEKRAAEDPPIRPKDLPCLPPSWIHEHALQILPMFERLIMSAKWNEVSDEDPGVVKAWTSFVNAIGRASGKEIRTSNETMSTVAGMMSCFRRYLLHQPEPQPMRLQRMLLLWKRANLGVIHPLAFTVRRLRWTSQGYTCMMTASSTQSESDKAISSKTSAITALLELICSEPIDMTGTEALAGFLHDFLNVTISTSPSRSDVLKTLRDVMRDLDTKPDFWLPDQVLWQTALKIVEKSLDDIARFSNNGAPSQLSASELQQIIQILGLGLCLGFQPTDSWSHTLKSLTALVSHEVGNVGLAIGFVELFASELKRLWSNPEEFTPMTFQGIVTCTLALLEHVAWPILQKDLRDARNSKYWGPGITQPEPLDVDPCESLCQLWNTVLVVGFQNRHLLDLNGDNKFLDAAVLLLDSIPQPLSLEVLQAIQSGIVMWLNIETQPLVLSWGDQVRFWKACARLVERLPSFDTATAKSIEPFLASLLSTEQIISPDDVLRLWQNTFGLNLDLIVPELVSAVLAQIQQRHDMDEEEPINPITGYGTEPAYDVPQTTTFSAESSQVTGNFDIVPPSMEGFSHTKIPVSRKMAQRNKWPAASVKHVTPKSSPKSRRSRHTPPKRLRHEDSQIVFAAIHSSPYDTEGLVSQFLTPHQREVRERQQMEADAMFPDIRSDPATRSARKPRKAPILSINPKESVRKGQEEWSSPISSKEPMLNDFVQSSPTPGSSRHASNSSIPKEGPPSSPPTKLRNRLALVGSDYKRELLQNEDLMEGVVNEEIKAANAADALAEHDSDMEPTLPRSETRNFHEKQTMDHNHVEPTLPELVGQKGQVTDHEIEKEVAIMVSASTAPTPRDRNEGHYGQAVFKGKVVPNAEEGELRKQLPVNRSPKVLAFMDTPMTNNPASGTDVYVDAPSSLPSTPKKDLKGTADEQPRENEAEQEIPAAPVLQHSGDAGSDVEDTTGSVAIREENAAARRIDDDLNSSDVDKQASQQIQGDLERVSTQREPAWREDSTSDEPEKSSLGKRKKSASSSPEKPSRKSPRRHDVNVVINKTYGASQEHAQKGQTVDEDGMLDCIVVQTSPQPGPAKKKATTKPRGESTRGIAKSRRQQSTTLSTSQRRHSSRLGQVPSCASSSYFDVVDERNLPDKSFTHPSHAPIEDREEPNNIKETSQAPPQDENNSVSSGNGSSPIQRVDLDSPSKAQEFEETAYTSTNNPSSSPTSSHQDTSSMAGTSQTAGNDLLLRLQNLVHEAKDVVLNREQQRRLLSIWMDLGQELHHADAESRAAKRT